MSQMRAANDMNKMKAGSAGRAAMCAAMCVAVMCAAARGALPSGAVTVATPSGGVCVSSPSKGALRVTRGAPVSPELVFVSAKGEPVSVENVAEGVRVRSGDLAAVVSRTTGLVRFEGPDGTVLSEREVGERSVAFDSPLGERLYGLGQFQDGALDVRNLPRRLVQVNTQVASPFLVSTRGWGLYWHTYAKVDFNPCANAVALAKEGEGAAKTVDVSTGAGRAKESRRDVAYVGEFEVREAGEYAFMFDCGSRMARQQVVEIDGRRVVDNRNFWLPPAVGFRAALKPGRHKVRVLAESRDRPSLAFRADRGETRFTTDSPRTGTDYVVYLGAPERAVANFRADTGGTAALPDWAWGYWHCQERFRSQADLLAAMRWFRSRGLPLSVIVQDWQWWRKGTWNSMEWDSEHYPDPKAMADECHANGVRVMLSVWSKTGGNSAFMSELKAANAFVPGTQWIDFSSPRACDVYWKWFERCCVSKGIDAWWLDAVEPENDDLHGHTFALGSGDVYRNVYPLLVNTEADRRMRALRPGETPLVLTRCAFAGQQRTASVVWSGDVGGSWDALRKQVVAGLGFAAAGFPYWTSDCGGFFRPGDQYTNKAYHRVLARWMEFATFCPVQRVHGYKSDTTPSRYGPEMERLLCDQIRLRERLKPYILKTANDVASKNAMFMRPLWDAPAGFETEYMFGEDMLVCPVTSDVEEMDVWLPTGEWRDFHTGEAVSGGRVLRVKVPLDRIPVYERMAKDGK